MIVRRRARVGILGLLAALACASAARAEPAAGSTWTEATTGMTFVWVPTGCIQLGSDRQRSNEQPAHKVCVRGFYLGRYEVTQAQFEQVMGTDPSRFKGPRHPVEQVDWTSATLAADKLGARSGTRMRLPSEAEWEYACRAGGLYDDYCGPGGPPELAWYADNSDDTTHDVGGKQPNAWGLFDMNGNVWEWTQDCYHDDYRGAPTDGSAWITAGCSDRVTRGGGWNRAGSRARATYRGGDGSTHKDDNIGFRLVRTLP